MLEIFEKTILGFQIGEFFLRYFLYNVFIYKHKNLKEFYFINS